ncbi:Glycosyltransferase AglD [uncultured archaeon]|nr:Glycosyltransferase AglD [uncultured archaeon]
MFGCNDKDGGIEIVEVSIVLPAYNESARMESTVERTAAALREITPSFEIIIAEDGSKDGTDRISEALAKKHDFVVHLHSDERQGRGRALNRAFKAANGEILGYIDVDLATDMRHLRELIQYIREGYDFATGSRMLPESDVKRPFKRGFASKGFNFLTRLMLGSKLYDHQCGFKSFRREPLFKLLDEVKDTHWFWDTELFVRAQRAGFKVKEFPVEWKHGGATKVNLVKDVFGMGSQIFRLWYEFLWD